MLTKILPTQDNQDSYKENLPRKKQTTMTTKKKHGRCVTRENTGKALDGAHSQLCKIPQLSNKQLTTIRVGKRIKHTLLQRRCTNAYEVPGKMLIAIGEMQ